MLPHLICLKNCIPSFTIFLTCHVYKASPRSVHVSLSLPVFSLSLSLSWHFTPSIFVSLLLLPTPLIHLLLLLCSYPLSFPSTSLRCMSRQPRFSLTLCSKNAHTIEDCINTPAYISKMIYFNIQMRLENLCHIVTHKYIDLILHCWKIRQECRKQILRRFSRTWFSACVDKAQTWSQNLRLETVNVNAIPVYSVEPFGHWNL